MARSKTPDALRTFRRMWVLAFAHRLNTDNLQLLDAQLTLPPGREPFRLGKCPDPVGYGYTPSYLEHVLSEGIDPDTWSYREKPRLEDALTKAKPKARPPFNLFERTAYHLPYSNDWLFTELGPYFREEFPPIQYSWVLIKYCLRRLKLRRLHPDACASLSNGDPDRLDRLDRLEARSLRQLADEPEPIHLVLLLALFHERQWLEPGPNRLFVRTWVAATYRFAFRAEFDGKNIPPWRQMEVYLLFDQLWRHVWRHGHRSQAPGAASWKAWPRRVRQIFYVDTAANRRAARILRRNACETRGYDGSRPSTPFDQRQIGDACEKIFEAAELSQNRWHKYAEHSPEAWRPEHHACVHRQRRTQKREEISRHYAAEKGLEASHSISGA